MVFDTTILNDSYQQSLDECKPLFFELAEYHKKLLSCSHHLNKLSVALEHYQKSLIAKQMKTPACCSENEFYLLLIEMNGIVDSYLKFKTTSVTPNKIDNHIGNMIDKQIIEKFNIKKNHILNK